jgi:hypothetical protein
MSAPAAREPTGKYSLAGDSEPGSLPTGWFPVLGSGLRWLALLFLSVLLLSAVAEADSECSGCQL